MASSQNVKSVNILAGETLVGAPLAAALSIDNTGRVILAASATSVIVGFLAEQPDQTQSTLGENVPVAVIGAGGVGKAVAGGVIALGELIIPTTTAGKVDGAANIAALIANQMAVGVALEAAAAEDDVIEVLYMSVSGPTA